MDFLVFSFVVTVIAENPPQVVRPTATSLEVNLPGGAATLNPGCSAFSAQWLVEGGEGGKKKKRYGCLLTTLPQGGGIVPNMGLEPMTIRLPLINLCLTGKSRTLYRLS